ncbi:BBA14 family lipoprotein [Borrelia persica]|uniref:BBA14 family lipoprotein n=1 Tax=Borrelia persica TaxID=44448 RepID=UPI0004B237DC|nr:BBA14 family lipoprotein [Borrelia persica]
MQINKKLIIVLIILLQFISLSCKSIAALVDEPKPPAESTLKNLSIYEAQLTGYALYLEVFLVKAKQKFENPNFPPFELFDYTKLNKEHTLQAVKTNIEYLKKHIDNTKPIALAVYQKYSKLQ